MSRLFVAVPAGRAPTDRAAGATRVAVAVAVAVALLLASILVALLHASPRAAGGNAVRPAAAVVALAPGEWICQSELVPQDSAAVVVSVVTGGTPGPPLSAELRGAGGRALARGRAPGGYRDGRVTIAIPVQRRTLAGGQVCLRADGPGAPQLLGSPSPKRILRAGSRTLHAAVRLDFQRPGSESWLALAPVIAHRFAIAKTTLAGAWLFWVALALVAAAAALGILVALGPRSLWLVAIAVVLNGVAWSVLIPPLQAFDEPVHVYYAERLAITGTVPRPILGSVLPDEELAVMDALRVADVAGDPRAKPPWTEAEDHALDRRLAGGLNRRSDGADGGVGVYPPLYYAAGAFAFKATPTASLLDRMAVMRLLSCLLAGVSALFVCLFARELVPSPRWASQAAGAVAAFQPLFGFMSGVFNPDLGVIAASSALFYLLARAFRRGLTPRLGALIGLALAAGFLSKLAMAGLIPGAALAVALAARRSRAWRGAVTAAVAAALPVAVYAMLNVTVWDRPALVGSAAPGVSSGGSTGGGGPASGFSFREALSYVWQDYLPPLPFMHDMTPGFPLWDRYFKGWVGRFGWGDYGFGTWVDAGVAAVLLVLLVAAVAHVLGRREAFAARWADWVSYAAMTSGLLFLLGYTGYDYFKRTGAGFEQGRYLLPLLPLYAALVAAGLRGLGARAGPAVAAALVVAAGGLSVWAQLLTIARFYA